VAAAELAVNAAHDYDPRFGAALAASVVLHAGVLMLSLPAPRLASFDDPVPLSVRLVQETVVDVAETARPARPAATRHARPRPAPRKHEGPPPATTTEETIQPAPAIEPAPVSSPERVAPSPVAASPQPAPESLALLAPAPPQRAPSAELLALYTKSLSEAFARHKEYPRIAEMRGWEGAVIMRLRVAPSGRLIAAELYKSSGFDALDKQAITMVSRAGLLPAPPEGLNADELPVLVPINFRLER
jgi:periplasmic protein TonB